MGSRLLDAHGAARVLAVALLLTLSLTGLLITSGCGSAGEASETEAVRAEPQRGGTYNFPLQVLPSSVSPLSPPEQGIQIAHQVFEGLVAYRERSDGALEVIPCLAESWRANREATVWTFDLRRGVTFQPPVGREMTARDVVATYRYGATRKNACSYAYRYFPIAGTDKKGIAVDPKKMGVEALGRYTVRFTLKRPYADFPETLCDRAAWIWPVDYLRRVGRERFGQQPSGTGPFMVERLVRGEYADLVRNPDWWDAASGRPYLDAVHFRVFPSVSAELQAFQKGLVDYTWVPQGQIPASRSLPQVRSGEWTAQTVPLLCIGYFGFRVTDPIMRGEKGLLLRRAINYACDRKRMIATVSQGVFGLPTGYVPSLLPGWQQTEFPLEHDTAKAASLYERAGSPRLTIVINEDAVARGAAEVLRADLAEVGIPLRIKSLSWEKYLDATTSPDGPAFFTLGWVADYPSADNFLDDLFYSRISSWAGTAYSDKEVDRLLTEARSTADVQRHLELNQQAARLVTEDLPMLPLFQFADYRLTSSRIGGFNEDPMANVDMWELWVR